MREPRLAMQDKQVRYGYRSDPGVPPFPDDRPIILFDGHCVMCSRFAQFILRHDRKEMFRLLPAQTPLGLALYTHYNLDPIDYETNILLEDGLALFKSTGSIRILERLGFPWSLASLLRALPLILREPLYDVIARNRLRLFGRRDLCYTAEAGYDGRFLA
jgi:predicted DCC family thiol-disulfide oxidoreductase YuxK